MTSRVALVTGGTGGIGTAITNGLHPRIQGRDKHRDEAKTQPGPQNSRRGRNVVTVKGDVGDPASAEAMVRRSNSNSVRSIS